MEASLAAGGSAGLSGEAASGLGLEGREGAVDRSKKWEETCTSQLSRALSPPEPLHSPTTWRGAQLSHSLGCRMGSSWKNGAPEGLTTLRCISSSQLGDTVPTPQPLPREHISISRDLCDPHNWGGGCCCWLLEGEASNARNILQSPEQQIIWPQTCPL